MDRSPEPSEQKAVKELPQGLGAQDDGGGEGHHLPNKGAWRVPLDQGDGEEGEKAGRRLHPAEGGQADQIPEGPAGRDKEYPAGGQEAPPPGLQGSGRGSRSATSPPGTRRQCSPQGPPPPGRFPRRRNSGRPAPAPSARGRESPLPPLPSQKNWRGPPREAVLRCRDAPGRGTLYRGKGPAAPWTAARRLRKAADDPAG